MTGAVNSNSAVGAYVAQKVLGETQGTGTNGTRSSFGRV